MSIDRHYKIKATEAGKELLQLTTDSRSRALYFFHILDSGQYDSLWVEFGEKRFTSGNLEDLP